LTFFMVIKSNGNSVVCEATARVFMGRGIEKELHLWGRNKPRPLFDQAELNSVKKLIHTNQL
jgi:hypothetical protein